METATTAMGGIGFPTKHAHPSGEDKRLQVGSFLWRVLGICNRTSMFAIGVFLAEDFVLSSFIVSWQAVAYLILFYLRIHRFYFTFRNSNYRYFLLLWHKVGIAHSQWGKKNTFSCFVFSFFKGLHNNCVWPLPMSINKHYLRCACLRAFIYTQPSWEPARALQWGLWCGVWLV